MGVSPRRSGRSTAAASTTPSNQSPPPLVNEETHYNPINLPLQMNNP
jgi:hypothetical protein